jgi:hypothetical protein
MASTYRRQQECDIWHFCSNCSKWPQDDYVEQWQAPRTGGMCNECDVKRRQGDCD